MSSSYLIGGTSLLIQCAEILQQQAYTILGVISADTAVADWATQHNIPHLHPTSDWVTQLQQTPFDYLFSIVNATIIPEAVLALPRHLAINYHDAPLPRYAGMYASSWALINGEREHGITWHEMTAVVDAGDILQQTAVPITNDDTALTLNAKCYDAAIQAFATLAAQLAADTVGRQPQDLSQRTYFGLYKRPFPLLDFQQPAAQIHNLVRGLSFGSYVNPLALPKILAADSVWCVGKTEILDTLSTEPPGTITAVTPTQLHISTATHDIALSQIATLDGQPALLVIFNVGDQLPLFAEADIAAITQQHEQLAGHESFWRRRLANFELPQLPAGLDLFDGKTGTAVHIATLARITGQTEFTLGWRVPDVDGRFFTDVVPLHIKISDDDTIEQIEATLQKELQAVQKRQTYPLDLCLRYPDLAQSAFALVFGEIRDWRLEIFSDQSPISNLNHAVTTNPNLLLRDMPLLSKTQEQQILVEWNETQVAYPQEQTVLDLFMAQVAQRPSAIAAVCGDEQLTYAQLHEKANQLAHLLQAARVKPGVTVGVYLPRSLDVLVALWGIWLAGGVYVPLDPEYPAGRLE
jgi:methionyl-tRNA formyltransferase